MNIKKTALVLRAIVVSLFVMMLGSCQKDPPTAHTPTEGGSSDTEEMWPARKISRIVHSVGTFDYLTYDFSWEGDLLKEINCTMYDGSSLGRTVFEYSDGRRGSTPTTAQAQPTLAARCTTTTAPTGGWSGRPSCCR